MGGRIDLVSGRKEKKKSDCICTSHAIDNRVELQIFMSEEMKRKRLKMSTRA
jgi:hypothetical protein